MPSTFATALFLLLFQFSPSAAAPVSRDNASGKSTSTASGYKVEDATGTDGDSKQHEVGKSTASKTTGDSKTAGKTDATRPRSKSSKKEPFVIVDEVTTPGTEVDWDKDELTDLIIKGPDDGCYLFINNGTEATPVYEDGVKVDCP